MRKKLLEGITGIALLAVLPKTLKETAVTYFRKYMPFVFRIFRPEADRRSLPA